MRSRTIVARGFALVWGVQEQPIIAIIHNHEDELLELVGGSSIFQGVSWKACKESNTNTSGVWQAQLIVGSKVLEQATFSDELEAARAYDRWSRQHYGNEDAVTNFDHVGQPGSHLLNLVARIASRNQPNAAAAAGAAADSTDACAHKPTPSRAPSVARGAGEQPAAGDTAVSSTDAAAADTLISAALPGERCTAAHPASVVPQCLVGMARGGDGASAETASSCRAAVARQDDGDGGCDGREVSGSAAVALATRTPAGRMQQSLGHRFMPCPYFLVRLLYPDFCFPYPHYPYSYFAQG